RLWMCSPLAKSTGWGSCLAVIHAKEFQALLLRPICRRPSKTAMDRSHHGHSRFMWVQRIHFTVRRRSNGRRTSFRCATVAPLALHAAAGHPNYQFEFARVPQGHEAVGATHASELEYVFGTFGSRVLRIPVHYSAVDREVSNAMQQYWTNFA